jgi:hypothetical protein
VLSLDAVPRHSEGVIFRLVGDEAIVLSLDSSYYYSLDPIGSEIWAMCDGTHSVQSMLDRVCAEYEVDWDRARRDLLDLIDDLKREELITIDGVAAETRPAAG